MTMSSSSERYKLLDLFCKAGGAGEGYRRAGFEVTGVDIEPQKNYKPGKFIQADALAYVAQYGWMYDAIHASPPCQAHTQLKSLHKGDESYNERHIDLIPQTRYWLKAIGVPYVIENVAGAKGSLIDPIMLCGAQFGLKVYRHRLFESNVFLMAMPHAPHRDKPPSAGHGASPKGFVTVSGNCSLGIKWDGTTPKPKQWNQFVSPNGFISVSGHFSQVEYARFAMGIDWMTGKELAQAIPPAYTEFIGNQLMAYISQSKTTSGISG